MIIHRIVLTGWLLTGGGVAHSLSAQQMIQSAGGAGRGASGTLTYSIGQVAFLTARGPSGTSTPGGQQPFEFFVLSTKTKARVELESSAFPNPTAGSLTLRIDDKAARQLTWHLQDVSGRQLLRGPVPGPVSSIPLAAFAAGTYRLVVCGQGGQELKSFRIIKH